MRRLAVQIYAVTARLTSPDPRYPCSICGTDKEAGINVMTTAGETFSKVAALFEVSRSAVYRHRKHFAGRILVDQEGSRKIMDEMQAFTDQWQPPIAVADMWRHTAHIKYRDPTADDWPYGLAVLAIAGIEPYRSLLLSD